MIFRAELPSAEVVDALAARIVKAIVTTATACTGLFPRQRRTADTTTLSGHQLRDIGLAHRAPGCRAEYDPYELLRPGFGGRR